MAAQLLLSATGGVALPGGAPKSAVGDPQAQVAALAPPAPPAIPAARAALAALLAEVEGPAAAAAGVADGPALIRTLGLHPNYYRLLSSPRHAGWRTPAAAMNPSMISDYRKLQVIGEALGIAPAVLWCAHMVCEGPRFRRTKKQTDTSGWSSAMRREVETVAADLDALGGVYAAGAARLRALACGEEPSPLDETAWHDWAVELVVAERARVGLPAEAAARA
jgi:hypothetical protein